MSRVDIDAPDDEEEVVIDDAVVDDATVFDNNEIIDADKNVADVDILEPLTDAVEKIDETDVLEATGDDAKEKHKEKGAAKDKSADDGEAEETLKEPPTQVPRRSVRPKKLPKKLQDYHLYQTAARPYNCKQKAVEILLHSGVLNEIDNDTAHRILASIFN